MSTKIHRGALSSPLPTELEPALEEILKLRSILIREREMLANIKIKAVCDTRANRGHIKDLRDQIDILKDEVERLREAAKHS